MPLTTTQVAIIAPSIAVLGSLLVGRIQGRRDDKRRDKDTLRERERLRDQWEREDRQRWLVHQLDIYVAYSNAMRDARMLIMGGPENRSERQRHILDAVTAMAKVRMIAPPDVKAAAENLWSSYWALSAYARDSDPGDWEERKKSLEWKSLEASSSEMWHAFLDACRASFDVQRGNEHS